jgi:hypothetical protein
MNKWPGRGLRSNDGICPVAVVSLHNKEHFCCIGDRIVLDKLSKWQLLSTQCVDFIMLFIQCLTVLLSRYSDGPQVRRLEFDSLQGKIFISSPSIKTRSATHAAFHSMVFGKGGILTVHLN